MSDSEGSPVVTTKLRSLMQKLGKSEPRPKPKGEMGAAGGATGGSTSAATFGVGTSITKLKVNFVPAEELEQIVGIGGKISKRMHLLRLVEGNLTPKRLRSEFGGKMTDTMLRRMDFKKNDMLVDRSAEMEFSELEPFNLKKTFDAEATSRDDVKHTKLSRSDKDTDETKPHTRYTEEVHDSPKSDFEEEIDASKKFKKTSARKPSDKKSRKENTHSIEDSEDDEEVKSIKSDKSDKKKSKDKGTSLQHRRKLKKKPVPVESSDNSETETDSEEEIPVKRKQRKARRRVETSDSSDDSDSSLRKVPKGFDRHLRFSGSSDGKGDDFDSFKLKFKSYAKAFKWSEEECRYCLCWSLQGAAARYHTLVSSGAGPLTYKQLMKKLEKRFGGKELIETAQARFNQACQEANESLEVWADRIQMLSLRAFRKVSERYAASQAVNRFCLGLEDREASKDVCLQRFKTMDEAKDYVHYYVHINTTNSKPKSSRRTSSKDHDENVNVYETSISHDDFRREMQKMQEQFDKKLALIKGAEQNSFGRGGYERGFGYQRENNQYNRGYGRGQRGLGNWDLQARGRGGRSGGGWDRATQETGGRDSECFHCGEPGHIRAECQKWWATQECFGCHQFGHRKSNCPNLQTANADNKSR